MFILLSGLQTDYDSGIISDNRSWNAQVNYYYNGTWSRIIPRQRIKSLTLSDYSTDGNNITMGSVVGGKLTLNLMNTTSSILSTLSNGTQLKLSLSLENASATIKSSIFVIDDKKIVKKTGGAFNATITAYDKSYLMTHNYITSLTEPTCIDIVNEIASKYGLGVNSSVQEAVAAIDGAIPTKFTPLADFTYKQTLGYMAGCYGCFAYINESDEICFGWYSNSGSTIERKYVYDGSMAFSKSDNRTIVMLESGTKSNPIVSPNNASGYSINFENPYITQAQADAIYTQKIANGKISYRIGKAKYKGNPLYSPGTIVTIKDAQNQSSLFYIMKRTLNYDGGLSETIESLGESETTISFKITSPTQQKIDRALSKMEEAIKKATDIITQTKGSIFEFIPIDENDPSKGNSGWKLYSTEIGSNNLILANSSGIGFSSNGGQSFNAMAMYIDENGIGHINANCIDVGKLSANVIDTSTLVVGGGSYDDLETLLNGVVETSNNSITKVDVLYGKNQSTTTPPTSWSTDAPVWQNGYYIWTKTQTTAGGVISETQPVCITGAKGQTGSTGATGADGEDGLGISKIEEQYYLSTSSTSVTSGSWSTNQPAWAKNKYIWTRSKVTWEDNTVTYTDAVLAKAINGANETANNANETANATELILGGLTAQQNNVTYINGAKILTGSVGAAQIAANAITAEKINVGWQSGNCATGWTSTPSGYVTVTSDDSYGNNPKITLSSSYTSGNIDVNGIPFYASAGDTLRFGCKAYKNRTGSNGIYLKYSSTSNGTYNVVAFDNNTNESVGTIRTTDKTYVVTNPGWYKIVIAFNTQASGAYVTNLYCYKDVKGEMIVNGKISSVNKNTYFDLDSGEIASASANDSYSSHYDSAKLTFSFLNNDVGTLEGYATNEAVANRRLILYSPNILEIGLGDKASDATATGLFFAYNNNAVVAQFLCPTIFSKSVGITGELLVDNQVKTASNYFAGLTHTRQDTGMTVKVGTGKNVPMFNGDYMRNTASLELSNDSVVRARLDLSESWGESCGVLTFQGYSYSNKAVIRSAPLELGQKEMWFNGKPIIAAIQCLLDELGIDWGA